jgi:hypothetical protein
VRVLRLVLLLLAPACSKPPSVPVCGLHSATAPVLVLGGKEEQVLAIGAKVMSGDKIKAKGVALLECFTGSLKVLDGDTVLVGELKEATLEGITMPRKQLKQGALVANAALAPSVIVRYSDNRFTPASSFTGDKTLTTGDYMKAFFTPNGLANLGGDTSRPDGPVNLPPPGQRPKFSRVHGGELGEGGPLLKVTDEVIFAESDDLATAALVHGNTYDLGRTLRLIIPDGAEGKLQLGGQTLDLEGPMDLRLR